MRNGAIHKRGEYLCYVTYMFDVTNLITLLVDWFPGEFMTDIGIFTISSLRSVSKESGENVCYVTCMMTLHVKCVRFCRGHGGGGVSVGFVECSGIYWIVV